MTFKKKVHSHYIQLVNDKIGLLELVLADLKESGTNETKSTAGDKHETALAMLQIEQANTRTQLQAAFSQRDILEKIDPAASASIVVKGSLIKTNVGLLFLSVALGKAMIDDRAVIALSPQSPLGGQLLGLGVGNIAVVNNNSYVIESIE